MGRGSRDSNRDPHGLSGADHLNEAGDIDDHGDGAVPEYGGAGKPAHLPVVRLQALDDHLLLPQHLVHEQRRPLLPGLHHHQQSPLQFAVAGGDGKPLVQPDHRDVLITETIHLVLAGDLEHAGPAGLDGLHDVQQRDDEDLPPDADQLPVQNGQCQRQLDVEGGSPARLRREFNVAAQVVDVAPDDVHPHAAPGDVADLRGGGKTGLENEILDLRRRQLLVLRHQTVFPRLGQYPFRVQPGAVVADPDDDVAPLLMRADLDEPLRRLVSRQTRLRLFYAVIHRVAYQVDQRIGDLLQDGLVHLRAVAADLQLDLLAQRTAELAHQVDEAVDLVDVDADGGLLLGPAGLGLRLARLRFAAFAPLHPVPPLAQQGDLQIAIALHPGEQLANAGLGRLAGL